MYVCLCKRITDAQIRSAVHAGASSLAEVRDTLGASSQCGKCGNLAREIVREALADYVDDESLFYAAS